ncbi:MAG TPA: DUF5916 domain-containing protein [Candidatus Eisenbacteria bacterium]|nr:DUF5916 domain-containing protein [Candidatus Eisenbacteria bacterium]
MKGWWLATLFLTLFGLSQTSIADERPRAVAMRAAGELRLDGALEEPDWARAEAVGAFQLIMVREGEAPSESTDVRVLVTDTHVWFGIRCENQGPGAVRASLSPRDQILDDDHISVHLDTYSDRHRAYIFGVNPHGVQLDGILDGGEPDFSWDAVWDAEARLAERGWTAEMAIPLRTLRFPEGGSGTWGLWIRRAITKNDEVCSWPLYRLAVAGDIMLQAGDLEGMTGVRGGGGWEAQPYAATTRSEVRRFGSVNDWHGDHVYDVGLDARYGITSTMTANLTVNPDYSQVEADALQIDVNQRFPLYFPEKRPFFLEGAETFNTFFRLLYTRRMADPLYGGKVIGKIGRWRVGAIALRDEGGGSTEGIGAGSTGGPSPPGYFSVGRLTYDLGENQKLGLLVTDHVAEPFGQPTDTLPGHVPSSHNTVLSAETRLRLMKSLFFYGQVAGSRTRFESPVATDEGAQESFSDYLSTLTFEWSDGTRHALIWEDYIGSRFRAEAGFFDRVDVRNDGFEATYTFRPENRWIRYFEPTTNGNAIYSTRGELQDRRFSGALRMGFQKQTFLETRATHVDELWLDTLYDRWRYSLSASNSLWRPLSFGVDWSLEDGIFYAPTDSASFLGWQEGINAYATARPSPRFTAELSATRSLFLTSRGGDEVYDIWLFGAKMTYQFTRRLYVRLYPQYDTHAKHLDADALIGYVLHPGTVAYLGMTGDFDEIDRRRTATQRSLFLKFSYVFQG